MEIAQWIIIFVVALIFLLKSADIFTDNAERVGLHFKIPPFIIGVTIIALGTSLPELATSISSVLHGHSEIVVGDVVGSNIANILLVLAVSAIVGGHLIVDKEVIKIDLPIVFGSVILLFITTLDGQFTWIEGILTLTGLITYITYNVKSHRAVEEKQLKDINKIKAEEKKEKLKIKYPLILVASGTVLYFSANFTIQSVIALSEIFKVGTEVIALSAVSIGTSLPELAVSAIAAKKGKAGIALGNVMGSNIFNVMGVMAIPAFFGALTIPPNIVAFHIPALVIITALYLFVTMDKEITKWEGIIMLLIYIAYLGVTFGLF